MKLEQANDKISFLIAENNDLRIKYEKYFYKYLYALNEKDKFEKGSELWLTLKENQFGGLVENVPRRKTSIRDPRTKREIENGGMRGGDRMAEIHHNYAKYYANYINMFIDQKNIILVEIGILKGTGLAIWCDLFPNGRIIGLDIDLENFNNNYEVLIRNGAFRQNRPELYEFDQFLDNQEYIQSFLKGCKINICIDDGFHSDEATLNTFKSFAPFLNDDFIYIIEDNCSVWEKIKKEYPQFVTRNHGEFTIVSKQ